MRQYIWDVQVQRVCAGIIDLMKQWWPWIHTYNDFLMHISGLNDKIYITFFVPLTNKWTWYTKNILELGDDGE